MGSINGRRASNTYGNKQMKERNQGRVVEKEDFLLQQIDEFRDKAKQLQLLVAKKENKVQELQTIVSQKEDKAEQLQHILKERREEADKLLSDFDTQTRSLVEGVRSQIQMMQTELNDHMTHNGDLTEEKLAELEERLNKSIVKMEDLTRLEMENIDRKLAEQLQGMDEKLTMELQKFNEAMEQHKGQQNMILDEKLLNVNNTVSELVAQNAEVTSKQISEVEKVVKESNDKTESVKTDIIEKIHSENVKCYRNVQTLFEEVNAKIDVLEEMEKNTSGTKNYLKATTWISVLTFLSLIMYILYSVNILNF